QREPMFPGLPKILKRAGNLLIKKRMLRKKTKKKKKKLQIPIQKKNHPPLKLRKKKENPKAHKQQTKVAFLFRPWLKNLPKKQELTSAKYVVVVKMVVSLKAILKIIKLPLAADKLILLWELKVLRK